MRFDVLTLFPGLFDGFRSESLFKKALDAGLVSLHTHDFRGHTADKHGKVDDTPYGGGPGMLIGCQPVYDCLDAVRPLAEDPGELILLTPAGEPFTQAAARELSGRRRLIFLCGRYEGFDDRVRQGLSPREISVGDFVLNGGEVAAMAVIEAVFRLLPGVVGDAESVVDESFGEAGLLEHPHYTRPREYRGMAVPDVLLSGDHGKIAAWRAEQSRQRTVARRPDLLDG
ncbi:MAG: tRNA (guanosine(37)-N1)-methyltransferase TrmD [Planctomycetota bacterium]